MADGLVPVRLCVRQQHPAGPNQVAAKPVRGGKTKPTFAATYDRKSLQIKRLLNIPGAKPMTFAAH
jgi:hypothetical protein